MHLVAFQNGVCSGLPQDLFQRLWVICVCQEEASAVDLAEDAAAAGSVGAEGSRGSIAWSQPYFAALIKFLRASKGGMPRLQAHLLQACPAQHG